MNRTNVEVLFDSVYTINQTLANQNEGGRGILQANVDHIKQCLEKEEYTGVLTAEQTIELNQTVASAEARIATLPVPPEESERLNRFKTKTTRLSS
jgi:hypothetical protein